MTDRIPLIVNAGAAQIQELPAGDNISITGNITAGYFIGNGSQLTGISGSGNVDFTAVASNIIPTGNSVYNLGNAAHQWGSLYLSNATIYMNGVPIGLTAGNVLTVDGNDVVTTNSSSVANIGNLSINGTTISLVSGASQTLVEISPNPEGWAYLQVPNDATANVANVRLHNDAGNIEITTGNASHAGGVQNWYFDKVGALNLPSPGTVRGNNVNIASNVFSQLQWVDSGNINIADPNSTGGPTNWAYVESTGFAVEVGVNTGNVASWSFTNIGNIPTLQLPGTANIKTIDNTVTQINSAANGAINLRAFNSTGDVTASSYYDSLDGTLNFYSFNPVIPASYNWRFDNGGSFTLPNSPGNVYFGEGANQPVIIPYNTGITINANRADALQNYIDVTQDSINIFSVNPINIDNSTTGLLNTDINILSGDDILLRGRNKPNDSESEGGDINIFAGQGANSTATGFDTNSGGDISIQGGAGGLAQGSATIGGQGGWISINAGDGGTSLDSVVGSGGYLALSAGSAQTASDPTLGGWGGSVYINAGTTTRVNENGGSIEFTTGGSTGLGYGAAGYLSIIIPSSNVGTGGTWTFSGTGKTLNVPANAEIYGANFGNLTVGCAGNTFITSSDYGANVKNWTFGYTGTLSLPGISTGTGTGEIADIRGTRTTVGITNDVNYGYAATFTGTTPALAYTASSASVFSAKVTFVIQTSNVTWGWEQFDVAVIKRFDGTAGVSISNRMNSNSANGDTAVTATINAGVIEIYLGQPGSGTAHVNYTATEFNQMID